MEKTKDIDKTIKVKTKRLCSLARKAFEVLNNKDYDDRIVRLEGNKEYSYALLNQWSKIEQTLKLLKYYDNINEEFPLTLAPEKFNANWKVLREIDKTLLGHILKIGKTKQEKAKALHSIRDEIVHYNKTIDNDTYQEYKKYATNFLGSLKRPDEKEFKNKLNNKQNKKQKRTK